MDSNTNTLECSAIKRDKSKSCKHQSLEGKFKYEKGKYIASFYFDDNTLKFDFLG